MDNGEVMQIGNIYPDLPNFKNRTSGRVYDIRGLSPCINTCGGGQREPKIIMSTDKTICLNSKVNGKQPSLADRIYDVEGIATACTVAYHPSIAERRIRKLTPRECFRLMGVENEKIDIIQAAGISNSQQYKLAGNSIVENVLYHLFRKMFCETENESMQPTLF